MATDRTPRKTSGQTAERRRRRPVQIAQRATDQLLQLVDRTPQGVTALERTDEGWRVQIEVVETARVPHTTDILAVYEVDLDGRGNLLGYSRVRRYLRGRQDGES